MINTEQELEERETEKKQSPVQDREQGFQNEGQGAEQREMEKEIGSLHPTEPSRKTLNRDKLSDRETEMGETQTSSRTEREELQNTAWEPETDSKGRRYQGLEGKYGDREPLSKMEKGDKGDMGNIYAYENSEF